MYTEATESYQMPTYGMATKVSVVTIGAMFLILGTIGNLLVISANRNPHMRTVTNMFITQLAVGDLAILFFCMPFTITSTFILEGWPFGEATCLFVMFARNTGAFLSVLTLTAMSVERYLMLIHPMKARTIWKRSFVAKIMAAIVLVSIIGASIQPAFLGVKKFKVPYNTSTGQVVYHKTILECFSDYGLLNSVYSWGRVIFMYIVPLVTIACLYGRIAWHLSKQYKNQELHSNEKVLRARKRVVYMLCVMIVMFAVSWLPMNVFYILWNLPDGMRFMESPAFLPLLVMTILMVYGNCITNPILYSFMSAQYRHEFQQIMCGCLPDKKAVYSESTGTHCKTSQSDIFSDCPPEAKTKETT